MLKTHSDCIVIIDDQPALAEVLEQILIDNGFTNVIAFTNPLEAFQTIRAALEPAFIITDFDMPGINGVDLLCRIEEFFPEIEGIVITGHEEQASTLTRKYHVIAKENDCYEKVINCLNNKLKLNKNH